MLEAVSLSRLNDGEASTDPEPCRVPPEAGGSCVRRTSARVETPPPTWCQHCSSPSRVWTLQTAVSRLPASLVRRCIVVINVLSLNTNCQTRNWVIRSPGQWVIFHVRVTESSFWPGVRPEIFRFSKKCPKCKTYIWNAEMTKVIARCLLLDWNHWMLVHAMNFYLYVWLLKIRTPLHISRYLECIIEQSHRVNWVAGFPGHWVTKCDPVPCLQSINQSHSII